MSTAATALRIYYTGAASDGAYQSNPNSLLGGFRSSVLVPMLEPRRINDMGGIKILDICGNGTASGASGAGVGTIRAVSTGSLAWTPPGGAEGTAVSIANGQSVVLEGLNGGTTEHQWIQVQRVLAADLKGSETVSCLEIYNNIFDDVSSAEAVAGATDYRAFIVKAGDENLTLVKFWFTDAAATTWQIAFETPGAGGDIQTIATDITAPTGLTWYTATSSSVHTLGNLTAGQCVGVWIKRTVAADTPPAGKVLGGLSYMCLTPSKLRIYSIPARHRVKRDDYAGWGVWIGQDADPDLDGAPTEIFTVRPYETTYVPAASHNYHLAIRKRNAYGLWELNREIEIIPIGATGAIDNVLPSAPVNVAIVPVAANNAIIAGLYYPAPDGDNRADGFVIWGTVDGATPSKSNTPTGYQDMSMQDGIEQLAYVWTTGAADAAPLKAIVSTRRLVAGTGTTQDADVNVLPASGAGSIGTSGSFSDWAASGGAVVRKANGYVREIVTYAARTDSVLTIAAGGRSQLWTTAKAGEDSDIVEPLAYVDSDNVDVVTATAGSLAPGMPTGIAFFGRESAIARGVAGVVTPPADRIYWIDEDLNYYIDWQSDNRAYLYLNTTLIWMVDIFAGKLYLTIPMSNALINGAGTDIFDTTEGNVYINVANVRRALINTSLQAASFEIEDVLPDAVPDDAVIAQFDNVVFSAYDNSLGVLVPYAIIDSAGRFTFGIPVDQSKTQAEIEAI